MKTLNTLFMAIFALVLFSCGNSRPVTEPTPATTDTTGTIREVADRDDSNMNRSNQNTATLDTSNSDMDTNSSTMQNRSNMDNNSATGNNMDTAKMDPSMSRTMTDDAEINVYWVNMKNMDQQSMYSALNMSEDQILKYQRGYTDYMDKMQNAHKRQTITQNDLMKKRDGILYDILKPAQYEKYKQWKMENPNYGM